MTYLITNIYAISDDCEFIKIGISAKPTKRCRELSTASPHKLRLIYHRKVIVKAAMTLEKTAHEILRDFSARGEWFKVSEQEAISAIDTAFDLVKGAEPCGDVSEYDFGGSTPVTFRLPESLLSEIEAWRMALVPRPTREAFILPMMERFLRERMDKAAAGQRKK